MNRIKHNDDHLLDFHGLTVAEARVMLVEGITQWWSRSEMQSSK
jgi:DNA-nicking Smr family endonuclease